MRRERATTPPAIDNLLQAGAAVDTPGPDGTTALHWATYRDDAEMVSRLLAAGADVNRTNRYDETPLWVSNSLSGRRWQLNQVPAVRCPPYVVEVRTGYRVSARHGERRVAVQGRVAPCRVVVALLHESSRARTMPTDRILTCRFDMTRVGRARSSDSGSHSRGRPHSPAQLDSGREGHRR